jgi:mono/diheme cytochrome c family protein
MKMPRLGRKRLALLAIPLVCIAAGTTAAAKWYSQHQTEVVARALTAGEPSRAPEIIRRYGCSGCHTIPGIPGADGLVGASLTDIKHRVYVGGVVFNSPENLIRWIVSPQTFSEHSAMPTTGISEAEARDVAAYLYAQ